jgi:conjugative transfer signal peptidase TraF
MSQLFTRITVGITSGTAIGGAAILLLGLACHAAGARINTTRSIPIGLYWTSSAPAEKGAYVLFCPPQASVFDDAKGRGYIGAGFCPGGYGFMMKRILAAQNDAISIAEDGVRVNGKLLPLSAPIRNDKDGRPLPRYPSSSFRLGNADVLLISDVSATSFDGRYFGPVSRSQIKSVISPVITW